MENKIMHADINHCFAQIMECLDPALKEIPMAVGGEESKRHGIILAKNLLAKKSGVLTGESLREAKAKCPNLLILPPNYAIFKYYSEKVKDIYREYSDRVESFGIDEAWVDLTHSQELFGPAEKIIIIIQKRVLEELGLTISVGLSFNKIFAKLASDKIKPSGMVIYSKENYKKEVWNLPVGELLMVGQKSKEQLNSKGIFTIGDIARLGIDNMTHLFGKMGEMLWIFAMGKDTTPVNKIGYQEEAKSVGNSLTTSKDISNLQEAILVFEVLTDSVAMRLKDMNQEGNVIQINVRDVDLKGFTRQKKIPYHTNIAKEILEIVIQIFQSNYSFKKNIRSVGVSVKGLRNNNLVRQVSLFVDEEKRTEQYEIEKTLDDLRKKYGQNSIGRLSNLMDRELTSFNPKEEHSVFPVSWL